MYKGDQWVGYDSPANVRRKMEYVKEMRLGGAMIWAVDLDDYLGSCGARWPLLSTMNRQLRRKESLGQSNRYLTPPCLALGGQVGVEVTRGEAGPDLRPARGLLSYLHIHIN